MSFNAKAVIVGTADTLVFECPAQMSGSVHGLVLSNNTATPATLTLKYVDHSEGTTTTIRSVQLAGQAEFTFPKPINVNSGDRILASASVAATLVALCSVYLNSAAPVATGFTGRGEWDNLATYDVNDIVSNVGSSYLSLTENTASAPPSADWMLLSGKADFSVGTVEGIAPDGAGNVALPVATQAKAGLFAAADKIKLDGVATSATANATDASLLARENHTGTQAIATVTDLQASLDSKATPSSVGAAVTAHVGAADPHAQYVLEEAGKGLSTNDYTTAEKTKLAGVDDALLTKLATTDAPALVRGTTLTGLGAGTATPIVSTDPLLAAFANLQAQVGAAGFRNIPQNARSAAYTAVLEDSGKHLLHPAADTTARTFSIPANSAVPYALGTAITFINQAAAGVLTITCGDTMRLAGTGTTGSRTLAANGVATAIKLTATEWIINGSGLT